MVRRPKADWVLGFWGFWGFIEFWGFLENNNTDSWNMLYIKIHEPMIFETQKIKFLIERI
jgi:hypothetical protein